MKKCDKQSNHRSSQPHMIYISSNNDRHPVTNIFTPLHYTCRHFTSSHLNFTQLNFITHYYPLICVTPFKFPTVPFHLTSLHFTSLLFNALLGDFATLFFLSLHAIYNCFLNSLSKKFRFTG